MKKITILGSTGSIGSQALEVVSMNPDKFEVFAVSCEKNTKKLAEQVELFKPKIAVTASKEDAGALSGKYPGTEFYFGDEGLNLAAESDCDIVLNALVGVSGLAPTYHAIFAGKDIALANKETLVAGGSLIMEAVKKRGVNLVPVDSEHSAIAQCLKAGAVRDVRRLILTASGGPFRGYSLSELKDVTVDQAIKHPKWEMGRKISVDSATMMNKGLEIIEAKWLFDTPEDKIDVVIHPQSIIHSMVEYSDGSVIAQLGEPDMRIPISYALGYPERVGNNNAGIDFIKNSGLTFEEPDEDTFVCLKLARQAIKDESGSSAIVLNAANEVMVQLFLEGKIGFLDIQYNIERALEEYTPKKVADICHIMEIDKITRMKVREKALKSSGRGRLT